MAAVFDHTCWRAIQVDHPADWELAVASGFGQPGVCVFGDRFSQRLSLQWKPLTYVPELEHILDGFRQKAQDPKSLLPLDSAPPPWLGLLRKTQRGWVAQAGRFFEHNRLLVEATVVWPGRRDENLERTILQSIDTVDTTAPTRPWRAMGLDLWIDSRMDLRSSNNQVGRVRWEFAGPQRRGPVLTVERLALPKYWLDKPLHDWLVGEMLPGHRILHQGVLDYNGHRGHRLVSAGKVSMLSSWRGIHLLRVDAAWSCQREERVYRVSYSELSRQEDLALPEHFRLRCCQPSPAVVVLKA